MSFAELLARTDLRGLAAATADCGPGEVAAALSRSTPTFDDFLALLSRAAAPALERMARRARQVTIQRFGRAILLYAPLYLTNECTNECAYCAFARRRDIPRRTLSVAEAREEALQLRGLGFRHLLLVAGEAPHVLPPATVAAVAGAIRGDVASLALEVQPLPEAGYRLMAEAGVDGLTLYQETYDRESYARFHPSGRKRDFEWRLLATERAGRAGLRRLGIGALLGLFDWRAEAIALALHAQYLMKHHWHAQVALSFPRLRHAPAGFTVPAPVDDAQLVQMMLAVRLFLPDAALVLSTREPPWLRDRLIPLGVTQMSAGSRTAPGAYRRPLEQGSQFPVEDGRTPAQVTDAIRAAGYDPVWKDWDSTMHEGIVDEDHGQRHAQGGG